MSANWVETAITAGVIESVRRMSKNQQSEFRPTDKAAGKEERAHLHADGHNAT